MLIQQLLVDISQHVPAFALETLAVQILNEPTNLEMSTIGLRLLRAVVLSPPTYNRAKVSNFASCIDYCSVTLLCAVMTDAMIAQRPIKHTHVTKQGAKSVLQSPHLRQCLCHGLQHQPPSGISTGPAALSLSQEQPELSDVDQATASAQLLEFMRSGGRPLEAHAATQFEDRLAAQMDKAMKFYFGVFGGLTLVSGSRWGCLALAASTSRCIAVTWAERSAMLCVFEPGAYVAAGLLKAEVPEVSRHAQGPGGSWGEGQVRGAAGGVRGGAAMRAIRGPRAVGSLAGADGRGAGRLLHQPGGLHPQGKGCADMPDVESCLHTDPGPLQYV